jgi:hypothetical protein
MKLTKIAMSHSHNQKNCLSLLVALTVMIWTAGLQVQEASAQRRPDSVWMPSGHADVAGATQQDPSMKAFIANNSKPAKKPSSGGFVHVVYLVPADKTPRDDYAAAVEEAILEMQAFYQEELGISRSRGRKTVGETFETFTPTVEVVVTPHDSAYYNANNQAGSFEFFFRAVGDGFEATGGGFNDPDAVWVYYIDADPACGQGTGGTSGVALLPANDLRGLVGEPNVPPCIGDPPDTGGVCRWVGGLGHELGHAFGLPHPPGCDQGTCSAEAFFSLMFFGYILYPDTYFLDEDKELLEASPFFAERKIRQRTNCLGEPLN